MAQLPKIFDQEVEPNKFDPIPEGWYQVRITGAEVKTTKAGTGQYVSLSYDILGPTHQGRKMWDNINISNPSRVCEEIGEQQMARIRSAIGLPRITDTDQLMNAIIQVKVKIKDDKNNVVDYKAIEGGKPPMPEQKKEAPKTPAFDSLPPWGR